MVKTCNDPADMPTGTIVAVGTVMINSLPAAKQDDMVVGVDIHIIMIPSPGGPIPTPLPHPHMSALKLDLSTTVKIMGKLAAMQGSKSQGQPKHIPQGGPFQKPPMDQGEVMMGSMNVMIGNGGGSGSGSGSGGGGGQSQGAKEQQVEGHKLSVKVVDKGGKPITGVQYVVKSPSGQTSSGALTGKIEKAGVESGNHDIFLQAIKEVKWSVKQAAVGDKVKLQVATVGIEDGAKAKLSVFVRDSNFPDQPLETLDAEVQSDKIEKEWVMEMDKGLVQQQEHKERSGKYSSPFFYYYVEVSGMRQKSGMLAYRDWIELSYQDADGKPLANKPYTLFLPNGLVRYNNLNNDGYAKETNLPPGQVKVIIDPR
jgi:uncharacterized Zn-binding protein involved in type VI secretion